MTALSLSLSQYSAIFVVVMITKTQAQLRKAPHSVEQFQICKTFQLRTQTDVFQLKKFQNNFIVHSVPRNETLLCFPCGGGHRAWDFCCHDDRAVFAHIKTREVVLSTYHVASSRHSVLKVKQLESIRIHCF